MKKALYKIGSGVIVLVMIAQFAPEIRAFYDNTLGKCVERVTQVAQLQKNRVQDLEELLDEIN
jgi:hypothetical protein